MCVYFIFFEVKDFKHVTKWNTKKHFAFSLIQIKFKFFSHFLSDISK